MAIVIALANLFDMAELCGARSRMQWAVAREMWAGGKAWAARNDGKLIAMAGFYPMEGQDGVAEAWFNVAPDAAGHMLEITRAIKLTIRSSGYREIVTIVRTEAGQRIAKAVGLQFFGSSELGEVWQWRAS